MMKQLSNKLKILHYTLFLFVFIGLIYFHSRGLFHSDDGYILNSASRVMQGQVPYKDFHFAYMPFAIYADVLSFKLFGISVLATRITALFVSLGSILMLFFIARKITKNPLLQYIPALVFFAWGPTHSNFIFPTMLSIFFGIATVFFFVYAREYSKNIYCFLAGIAALSTFFSKQNFGVVLLLCIPIVFMTNKALQKRHLIVSTFMGILFLLAVFFCLLLITNSFYAFLSDFYIYTIKRIIFQSTLTTPFPFDFSLRGISKAVFYLSPILFSLGAFIAMSKKQKKDLFIVLFVVVFYISGIRPTTDYIHLTPLLSLSGLPILFLILHKEKLNNLVISSIAIFFIALGFYTGFYFPYYRWNKPLINENNFLSHPRFKIFASDDTSQVADFIDAKTKPGDYIFVDYYFPIFYFASNRKNPTKFDLLEGGFYIAYEKEIIWDIEKHNTKLIITQNNSDAIYLSSYIKKNFPKQTHKYNLVFWER